KVVRPHTQRHQDTIQNPKLTPFGLTCFHKYIGCTKHQKRRKRVHARFIAIANQHRRNREEQKRDRSNTPTKQFTRKKERGYNCTRTEHNAERTIRKLGCTKEV